MVNIRNEIKESFEVRANEIGFCLDQRWGQYENPYINNDTALAYNLFKDGWIAANNIRDEELNGCVVVHETELETCYYDEYEGMYLTNHDFLKNIDVGEAVEVKRQYFWETKSLFAAITWDEVNKKEGSFQLFNSHDEADKAASHCKAMLEATKVKTMFKIKPVELPLNLQFWMHPDIESRDTLPDGHEWYTDEEWKQLQENLGCEILVVEMDFKDEMALLDGKLNWNEYRPQQPCTGAFLIACISTEGGYVFWWAIEPKADVEEI